MKFAAVILAGGKSRRMGKNKAEMSLGNRRVIDVIAEKLTGFCEIFISSDNVIDVKGCVTIADEYKNMGPAAGILTALKRTSADALFVIACDMPLISDRSVKKMLSLFEEKGHNVVLNTECGLNPLFAVYRKKTAEAFEKSILEGELSLRKIINGIDITVVKAEEISMDKKEFLNMNTPEDYRAVREVFYETEC